ncbi:MAG: DUF4215 domain-containing protein [Myxococcota bacterium]
MSVTSTQSRWLSRSFGFMLCTLVGVAHGCGTASNGVAPHCGDGIVPGFGNCDDGNTTNGDGCSSQCAVESGWRCEGSPSVCRLCDASCNPLCGNGELDDSETCDDGNVVVGDGCDALCQTEAAPDFCTANPGYCVNCGDGNLDAPEECDDGNEVAGDGCSVDCRNECPEGYYDAAIDLCWENPQGAANGVQVAAQTYCAALASTSGKAWRVPQISDLRSLVRSCATSALGGACPIDDVSDSGDSVPSCNGCVTNAGPGVGGCYWPSEMGACADNLWSASVITDQTTYVWVVRFSDALIAPASTTYDNDARCVRDGP